MRKHDFKFDLPKELIANRPCPVRSDARLLRVPAAECDGFTEHCFRDVVTLLRPGDLLVVNDSRVIRARFYARKATGGRVEVLIDRIDTPQSAYAYLGTNRKIVPPITLSTGVAPVRVSSRARSRKDCYLLQLDPPTTWTALLERIGEVPLPPYMRRRPEAEDDERYQTVYARHDGSVAAPTAGLHFDPETLDRIRARGVDIGRLTLHVGGGTFLPLRHESLDDHTMHSERLTIGEGLCEAMRACRQRGGRVVAVGTTVLRALETATDIHGELHPYEGETDIFIQPGWRFRSVDMMITNFHLPETTLFVLVCAFCGRERMLEAYRYAIERKYRFFSYGDAMWLERAAAVS